MQQIISMLAPMLPNLLQGQSADQQGFPGNMLGGLWEKIGPVIQEHPELLSQVQQLASNPQDNNLQQAVGQGIQTLLQGNPELLQQITDHLPQIPGIDLAGMLSGALGGQSGEETADNNPLGGLSGMLGGLFGK
jgi:hypothetical protein